jgi:hypothetical protein
VLIDGNDFNVQRAIIRDGPYSSIDGEGILVQQSDAGYIENVTITNNLSRKGLISIFKMRYARDINISNNQMLGGDSIRAEFDSNSAAGSVYGLTIEGNDAAGILFASQIYPYEVAITNNTISGSLNISDYGVHNANVYTLAGNSVAPTYELHNGHPFPFQNLLDRPPQIEILEPVAGDVFVPGTQVTVRAQVTMDPSGATPLDTVLFYDGTKNGPNDKNREWNSTEMNNNFGPLSAVQLTLEGTATDVLGSGIYSGTWTVPTGIGYANLFAEARAQSETIRSSDIGGTLSDEAWAARTWAFLQMAASTGGGEPSGYRPWIEGAANISSGQDGMNEDPDKDGLINLLEYAFGTLPGTANTLAAPIVEDISGTDYISVTFDKAVNDVNYNPR